MTNSSPFSILPLHHWIYFDNIYFNMNLGQLTRFVLETIVINVEINTNILDKNFKTAKNVSYHLYSWNIVLVNVCAKLSRKKDGLKEGIRLTRRG